MSGPYERDDELREEDVTAGDRLDDRVAEGEGLPGHEPDVLPPDPEPDE